MKNEIILCNFFTLYCWRLLWILRRFLQYSLIWKRKLDKRDVYNDSLTKISTLFVCLIQWSIIEWLTWRFHLIGMWKSRTDLMHVLKIERTFTPDENRWLEYAPLYNSWKNAVERLGHWYWIPITQLIALLPYGIDRFSLMRMIYISSRS